MNRQARCIDHASAATKDVCSCIGIGVQATALKAVGGLVTKNLFLRVRHYNSSMGACVSHRLCSVWGAAALQICLSLDAYSQLFMVTSMVVTTHSCWSSCCNALQDKKRRQYLITALPETKVDLKRGFALTTNVVAIVVFQST